MSYGIITVQLPLDNGGTRPVTFVTKTSKFHLEFAAVCEYSKADGTDVWQELLLGATVPPDALAVDNPLALELIHVYDSRPGGALNPHNLMDD